MSTSGDFSSSENVLGELYMIARLIQGHERLRVMFTARRIVVVHLGKRGIGAAAASSLLGRIGHGLEDLILSGKERGKRGIKSPQQILEMDAENFDIPYEEIVSLECRMNGRFVLVTLGDKFDLVSLSPLTSDLLDRLRSILGPRMTIR